MMRVSKRNEREGRGEGRRVCVRACVLSFTSTYPPMKSPLFPELVMRHGEMVAGVLFVKASTASCGVEATSFVAAAGDRSQHMRPMTAAPLRMAERCMMVDAREAFRAMRSERGVSSEAFRAWRVRRRRFRCEWKEKNPSPRGLFVVGWPNKRVTLIQHHSRFSR